MNSLEPIVSGDISVNTTNTGITTVNRNVISSNSNLSNSNNQIYHRNSDHSESDDLEDNGDDVISPDNNYIECHNNNTNVDNNNKNASNSMPIQLPEPTCSQSSIDMESSGRKRRKQSNPVRYGQTVSTHTHTHTSHISSIHNIPMELEEEAQDDDDVNEPLNDEDDDESLVAAGLRVAEELQRPGSFGSSDDGLLDEEDDDDDGMIMDDEKPLSYDRRKLIEHSITSVMNFHRQNKYQHYCPHCSFPFSSDDELRSHIEEEHVQRLLERQLFHHQQQLSMINNSNKATSNGPNSIQMRPSSELLASLKSFEQFRKAQQQGSGDGSGASGSNTSSDGSNNNSPLQSPNLERKPFDQSHLPQGSGDNSAKDFSNFLPFQLPNMPPLIPMSQAGSNNSDVNVTSKMCPTTSAGGQQIPLAMFPNHPMAPFLFPVLPGQTNNGNNGNSMSNGQMPSVNASGMRIFNPEAYCELCNKEFCNKYFLKTHKANKHGIYSMDIVGTPPYPGGAFFPTAISQAATINSNNQQAVAAAAAMQMQQLLQQSAGSSPMNPNPDGSITTMSTGMTIKPGMINIESFCEICQKEFCNKYFLKKHRQKIHGIIDPNDKSQHQSSSASPGSSHSNEMQNKTNSPSPSPSVASSSAPLSVTPTAPMSLSNVPNSNEKLSQGPMACDVCKQEFPNAIMMQTHRFTAHGPATSLHSILQSVNISNAQSMNTISDLPGAIRPPMSSVSMSQNLNQIESLSSGNSLFTPEKLREMGVINADAFCEICCKEFCNKYFLRTHKINKHGLHDGNSSSKSQKGNDDEGNNIGSPTNSNNDDSFLEPGQRDPSSYVGVSADFFSAISSLSAVSADLHLECDVCNRPFASNYLLKMHKFYSHNIPYIKEEDLRKSMAASQSPNSLSIGNDNNNLKSDQTDGNETGQNEIEKSSQSQNQDQASQDLQKLQTMIKELNNSSGFLDRSMCNLCRQEFENKYFLRVHMMNDHGIIPNDDQTTLDQATIMRSLFDPRITFTQQGNSNQQQTGGDSTAEYFCDLCQKEFCSKYFMKNHRQNVHGIYDPPSPGDVNVNSSPNQFSGSSPHLLSQKAGDEQSTPINLQIQNKNKQPIGVIGTGKQTITPNQIQMAPDAKTRNVTGRNYCNICNKELCNKYFMKTHMLKMHGINIDEHPAEAASTSTIGGVTCDICQKELCSKYFLKVHKQNTHGIYEEPPQAKGDSKNSQLENQSDKDTQAHGIDPNDTNNRYFSHYTEVCPLCERRFKSIKWLKTHMINDHSDIVAMRPTDLSMNPVSVSGPGVGASPNASDAFARMCMLCGQSFGDRVALHIHLVKDHRTTAEELSGFPNSIKLIAASQSQQQQQQQPTDLSQYSSMDHSHSSQSIIQHPVIQQIPLSLQMPKINGTTSPANSVISTINFSTNQVNSTTNTITSSNNNSNNGSNNNSNCLTANMTNAIITSTTSNIIIPCTTVISSLTKSNLDNNSNTSTRQTVVQQKIGTSNDHHPHQININSLHRNQNQNQTTTNSLPIVRRTGNGTRQYQCSYCSYITRWLSNLYAHEKRHNRANHTPSSSTSQNQINTSMDSNSNNDINSSSNINNNNSINSNVNVDGDKKFVCRICHRAYRYNHSLQRHLHSHRMCGHTGLILNNLNEDLDNKLQSTAAKFSRNQLPGLGVSGAVGAGIGSSGKPTRYRCSKCSKKFSTRELCLAHIKRIHKKSTQSCGPMTSKVSQSCQYCGFETRNNNMLKLHIMKCPNKSNQPSTSSSQDQTSSHLQKSLPLNLRKAKEQSESALSLVTNNKNEDDDSSENSDSRSSTPTNNFLTGQQQQQQLQSLAAQIGHSQVQQGQFPMTYAMPQSPPNGGPFIMQPFLITQPHINADLNGNEGQQLQNDTFVPSLVYLPVAHKVLQPVKVAFQLTPA